MRECLEKQKKKKKRKTVIQKWFEEKNKKNGRKKEGKKDKIKGENKSVIFLMCLFGEESFVAD